ncbi:MAG: tail fiber protein [Beduini sp.]|uniref:tail fiber protein n=1 Tax=Beduini sp. TaxID=1922300 RepID=UPI0039A0192C
MFQITQNGLTLEKNFETFPTQYSENVKVAFIRDPVYNDHIIIPFIAYGNNKQYVTTPKMLTDDTLVFPKEVFEESGIIALSFSIAQDDEVKNTNVINIRVNKSSGKSNTLPADEETWKMVLSDFLMQELRDHINPAIETVLEDTRKLQDIAALQQDTIDKLVADNNARLDNLYNTTSENVQSLIDATTNTTRELMKEAKQQQETASDQQALTEQQQTNTTNLQEEVIRQQSEAKKQQGEVNKLIKTSTDQQTTITKQQGKINDLITEAENQQTAATNQQMNASNLQKEAAKQQGEVNALISVAEQQQDNTDKMQSTLTINLEEYKRMLDAGEFIPEHKWEGTTLYFKNSDGTWGEGVPIDSPDLLKYMQKSGGTFTGSVTMASGVKIPNNISIFGKTTLGTYANLTKVSSDDKIYMGTVTLPSQINSSVAPVWSDGSSKHKFIFEGDHTTPVGVISQFAGETAPSGYLLCQGQAISRTEYAKLFDVISTKYGAGDGSTTFNLPDLRSRIPVGMDDQDNDFKTLGITGGAKTVTLTTNQIPAHNHSATTTVNSGGAHTHSASNTSAGSHAHTSTSDSAGGHTHTINNSGNLNIPLYVDGSATDKNRLKYYPYGQPYSVERSLITWDEGTPNHSISAIGGNHAHSMGSGGVHTHTVTVASNGAHSHTITVSSGGAHTHTATTNIGNTGDGQVHNNMQPYIILNYIIKY